MIMHLMDLLCNHDSLVVINSTVDCLKFLHGVFTIQFVFETSKVGIIAIFVLLKYEIELEPITSDISFNSVSPGQILICIQIHLVGNYFQFISI